MAIVELAPARATQKDQRIGAGPATWFAAPQEAQKSVAGSSDATPAFAAAQATHQKQAVGKSVGGVATALRLCAKLPVALTQDLFQATAFATPSPGGTPAKRKSFRGSGVLC